MKPLIKYEDGIYENGSISDDLYHRDNTRVNCSTLKQVLSKNGATVFLQEPKVITEAMRIGTALHSLVLETEKFHDRFFVYSDVSFATKKGMDLKAQMGEFVMLNERGRTSDEGRRIAMSESQYKNIVALRKGLIYDIDGELTRAGFLLQKAIYKEIVILFHYMDIPCKCKIDAITNDWQILDIKTCQSVDQEEFQKAVYNFHYDIQAVFYKIALKEVAKLVGAGDIDPNFYFLVVEKTEGFNLSQTFQTDVWDALAKQIIDVYLPITYYSMTNKQYNTYNGQNAKEPAQIDLDRWQENKRRKLLGV